MKKIFVLLIALFIIFSLTACEELYYQEFSVSGKVEDQNGNGIENVEILFNGIDKITTNEDGEWSKSGLTGNVKISFNKDKYNFNQSVFEVNSAKNINVTGSFNGSTQGEGEGGEPITTYNLSGKITDKNNNPLENVIIRFDKEGYSSVKTDQDGKWNKSVNESVIVTPEKNGWKFEPENRTIDSDDDYVDFVGVVNDYKASGKVEDDSGNPLADITINFSSGETTNTGTEGNWSKSGLEGKVTITPESEEYTFAPSTEDVTEETTGIVFTGTKKTSTYNLSGKITDKNNNPLQNVIIRFNNGYSSVKTDGEGNWSKSVNENVVVTPEKNDWKFDPENRSIDSDDENVNFIGIQNNYQVSGTVEDSNGNPISDITISFSNGETTKTGTDGSWTMNGLKGEVTITPESEDYTFAPSTKNVSEETTNILFTGTKKTYQVSGTVTYEENGEPIPEVEITFSDGSESSYTDSQGNWTKNGLNGDITITPKLEDWQFIPSNKTVSAENTNVNFTAIPGNNYEFYSASGKIVDTNYNPIPGVLVKFRREDGTLLGTAISDKEGNWNEEGLWGQVIIIPDPTSDDSITSFTPSNQKISGESTDIDFIAE